MINCKKIFLKLFFCYPKKDELKNPFILKKNESEKYTIGGVKLDIRD
jgi:hypothetical protein